MKGRCPYRAADRLLITAEMSSAVPAGPNAAAPRACTVRPAMIHPGDGASAPMSEPAVNRAVPTSSMRLRPTRSASTPHGINVAALTIVNRLLIHESWAGVASGKSSRIAGNVTTMIDMLMPVSAVVAMTIASTQPERGARTSDTAGSAVVCMCRPPRESTLPATVRVIARCDDPDAATAAPHSGAGCDPLQLGSVQCALLYVES